MMGWCTPVLDTDPGIAGIESSPAFWLLLLSLLLEISRMKIQS